MFVSEQATAVVMLWVVLSELWIHWYFQINLRGIISKIIKFLLSWKSLSEKIDGVMTVEVTAELPSSCPAWPDAYVCDGKYSWWKALLNFTSEMCVLDDLHNRNQRK